ncbi:unnamed protein product [Ectocarpus sp. CCAP 1310/34]|nr:unnamed protein product [Ectocarpus sp. CCAP 1310/34]
MWVNPSRDTNYKVCMCVYYAERPVNRRHMLLYLEVDM